MNQILSEGETIPKPTNRISDEAVPDEQSGRDAWTDAGGRLIEQAQRLAEGY
jgi:hypothetical protein